MTEIPSLITFPNVSFTITSPNESLPIMSPPYSESNNGTIGQLQTSQTPHRRILSQPPAPNNEFIVYCNLKLKKGNKHISNTTLKLNRIRRQMKIHQVTLNLFS